MSWINELYRVYELAVGTEAGKDMLPVSHSTAHAQIEISINDDGEFVKADIVSEEDSLTIIPDTGKPKTGIYGGAPYPLNESLKYIAGDLKDRIPDDIRNDKDKLEKYINILNQNNSEYLLQLKKWVDSEYSHKGIQAIYCYVEKKEVVSDCIKSGILKIDDSTGNLIAKQYGQNVEKCFVRFMVYYKDINHEMRTWKDKTLYDSFASYNNSDEDKQLCYATGKYLKKVSVHPVGIVKTKVKNSNDSAANAKLISSNDDKNFTYRGRFNDVNEAITVSYDYSQKMHNALKWLIQKQSHYFESLTLITWNSALDYVPSVTQSLFDMFDDNNEEYDTIQKVSDLLNKSIIGNKLRINDNKKIMIMGLEAASKGRLSIALYTEIKESEFYNNLKKWHSETAWNRFKRKLCATIEDSCSLPCIANCLYGTEQEGVLSCDKGLVGDLILRLLPCVTEGKRIPHDVVMALYQKASSPLSYEKEYNHRIVIENACALIRKEQADHDNKLYYKGEIKMAFDPNCTDRSYLYGCLLAIADKAEIDAYEKEEKRITNARRLWNAFSARPYQTWQIIEERLEPYLEKKTWIMTKYTQHINKIMSKMSPEDYADNSKLSPMYLIGFHHYNALLWNDNKTAENIEEE